MQLRLDAIQFNHDKKFATTGSFNIRRNESQTITVPEWEFGRCYKPECSPVAYANSEVPATITIKARFSCSDPLVTNVKVKALDANVKSEVPPGFRHLNVLGDVEERSVNFTSGQSDYEIFELKKARISEAGVSASDNIWLWQFSFDSKNWIDFQTTEHRIYTVLKLPTPPWEPRSPDPSSIQVPWTEALEYACHWAAGLNCVDAAATSITKRVFDLGKTLVTYCPWPSYANGKFDLSRFLTLLESGSGKQTLNCVDCATIVSTFADILGCDLSQSGMGEVFGTNQILPIGKSYWNPTIFLYHAVAWHGECTEGDILFDACLKVDGDGRPGRPPQAPMHPSRIRFGTEREKAYKFSLAKSGTCDPIPKHSDYGRKRRLLGRSHLGQVEITDASLLDFLREHYSFDSWPTETSIVLSSASLSKVFAEKFILQDWNVLSCEEVYDKKFTIILQALFEHTEKSSERFSIDLYECAESKSPNDFLLQLLASFEQLNLSRMESSTVGEVAFVQADAIGVLFRRGRFVAVVRSAGRRYLSVVDIAMTLDQFIQK